MSDRPVPLSDTTMPNVEVFLTLDRYLPVMILFDLKYTNGDPVRVDLRPTEAVQLVDMLKRAISVISNVNADNTDNADTI